MKKNFGIFIVSLSILGGIIVGIYFMLNTGYTALTNEGNSGFSMLALALIVGLFFLFLWGVKLINTKSNRPPGPPYY